MRIKYFDIAKGIAILAVIIGHLGGLPEGVSRTIFSFHMPLFFLISGYFLKNNSVQSTFCKLGGRLVIPYAITALAITVLSGCKAALQGKSIKEVLTIITEWLWASFYGSGNSYMEPVYIKQIGAVWFLFALFFASLLVVWALKYKCSSIIIIACVLTGYFSTKVIWLPLSIQAGLMASGYVYLGYMAYQCQIPEKIKSQSFVTLGCFLIWIIGLKSGCGRLYMVQNYYGMGIWDIFVSVCAVVVIIQIARFIDENMKRFCNSLVWFGQNSLYILCLHLVEVNIVPWGILKEYIVVNYSLGLYFVIVTILKIIWAAVGTLAILKLKERFFSKKRKYGQPVLSQVKNRIEWIDVVKGFAILLMVFAHLPINGTIRTVIFSWHMSIFMLLSGYLFKNRDLKTTLKNKVKGLLVPYLVVEGLALFIAVWRVGFYDYFTLSTVLETIKARLLSTSLGISFASTIFTDVRSVGPIWFVPCLFITNMIMAVLLKISKEREWLNAVIVCVITAIGYWIGIYVAYLPFSIDVAMLSVSFFYAGYLMKKYDVLSKIKSYYHWILVMTIWLVMLYAGGIELAVRSYPVFPLCIFGAIAGCVIVIEFCKYLMKVNILKDILGFCGRFSIVILGIHRLEMSYCPWKIIIGDAGIYMYFLLKVLMIFAFLTVGLYVKTYFQSVKQNKIHV